VFYEKITPSASRKGYTGPDDKSSSIFNYFGVNPPFMERVGVRLRILL